PTKVRQSSPSPNPDQFAEPPEHDTGNAGWLWPGVLPEEVCDGVFPSLILSSLQNERFKRRFVSLKREAVELHEYERRHCSHSLIAINEGVILNDMIEIRGGHFKQIGMKILIANPGFRHSECRMQQLNIADTKTPTIPPNLVGMNLNDILD
ncbi:MAG: hypothetical protein OEV08_14290, partial [Nitrospira sp.]|nr:hypothetical protein [Nitrospira sp.]